MSYGNTYIVISISFKACFKAKTSEDVYQILEISLNIAGGYILVGNLILPGHDTVME